MILKDQQPRPWGDEWVASSPLASLTLPQSDQPRRIVLCQSRQVLPMFGLQQGCGYDICLADESPTDNLCLQLEAGATAEIYRIQGPDTDDHITQLDITMQEGATLTLGTFTLGGNHVRNNISVRMQGSGCTLYATGLYLIDRAQQCDNYIFVEHAAPHCTSRELYKGIVDDQARARFNGHVLVQEGAVKTEAYQTNRNILLTDKAHVDTRPFLEIYNDDVKCSHGSTIGQLDEQALFYLQTRGISERTAITMLSYAFCDEVIASINIPSLRESVADVVKKRLHGELSPLCDDCAIRCSSPCNGYEAHFEIDPTKL